jgi:hypothetical protein
MARGIVFANTGTEIAPFGRRALTVDRNFSAVRNVALWPSLPRCSSAFVSLSGVFLPRRPIAVAAVDDPQRTSARSAQARAITDLQNHTASILGEIFRAL